MSNRKPHGMAVLTVITIAWDANISVSTVDSQNVTIVRSAVAPATGWITFIMAVLPFSQVRVRYATQMPGAATFGNSDIGLRSAAHLVNLIS
jgi:hypothetical protein